MKARFNNQVLKLVLTSMTFTLLITAISQAAPLNPDSHLVDAQETRIQKNIVSSKTITKAFNLSSGSGFNSLVLKMDYRILSFMQTEYCGRYLSKPGFCSVFQYDGIIAENIRLEGVTTGGKKFVQKGMYAIVSNASSRLFEGDTSEELGQILCSIVSEKLKLGVYHTWIFRHPRIWKDGKIQVLLTNAEAASDDFLALSGSVSPIRLENFAVNPAKHRGYRDAVTGKKSVFCPFPKEPKQIDLPQAEVIRFNSGK